MNLDSNEEQKKLVLIASLLLVEEATLFAAVLGSRRRKLNPSEPALKAKVGSRYRTIKLKVLGYLKSWNSN